jgi:hypothetical protein
MLRYPSFKTKFALFQVAHQYGIIISSVFKSRQYLAHPFISLLPLLCKDITAHPEKQLYFYLSFVMMWASIAPAQHWGGSTNNMVAHPLSRLHYNVRHHSPTFFLHEMSRDEPIFPSINYDGPFKFQWQPSSEFKGTVSTDSVLGFFIKSQNELSTNSKVQLAFNLVPSSCQSSSSSLSHRYFTI